MVRESSISRQTTETSIDLRLLIDGTGKADIKSGNGFMDHMLTLFTRHGLFDLTLRCDGDTHVDFHHSAEDIGICLGQAFAKSLGDHKGIFRYGHAYVPMDESLVRVCADLCGRPNLIYEVALIDRKIGEFESDLAQDFFKALVDHAGATMHVDLLRGRNSHHALEAVFKASGRALGHCCSINPRASDHVMSTKGVIDKR